MTENTQSIEIFFRGKPEALEFHNIIGYQLGSGFLGVLTPQGKTFIYPQDTIEYAVHSQIPQE